MLCLAETSVCYKVKQNHAVNEITSQLNIFGEINRLLTRQTICVPISGSLEIK